MRVLNRKMRTAEAAMHIGIAPSTLAKMRVRGDGPPYSKAGRRIVIYDEQHLDRWLAARLQHSTSDRDVVRQTTALNSDMAGREPDAK